ncbi:hypothetical protein JTE90_007419 [Oedothorax gibbosus]|uniref:Peptidase aspartic putative domain-containing protein n=1 Tax=Oedothorax gibbosus TaxID=931172 RepID=A0AAV6TPH6_9ARAC|nr:hypothetical protein JTE90_007419 [Oedothorax gibbosus]
MSTDSVLNRRRGNIRGQLTKLCKSVDEEKECNLDILLAHQEQLCRLAKKFEDLKVGFYETVADTEIDSVEATLSEMDDEISKLEVRLLTSIQKIKISNNKMPNDDPRKVLNEKPANSAPKLPDITLPIFCGKIEEYSSFKSQFINLIDQNSYISDVDKLCYLRGALRDEAKGIQTLDDSYSSLFEALDNRYDNKRLVIDTHIKALLNFEPIKHDSEKDIRNFTDCIKRNLRALSVLKLERDILSSAILLNVFLSKIDKDTRKLFEASLTNNEVPDFDEFIAFLERRAQILGSIARNTKPNTIEKSKTFLVKSNKFSKACLLCQMKHPIYQCSKFKEMKLEDRFEFCKLNKIYMKCLSHNYDKNGCQSKGACKVCSRANHHTLLHKYSTYTKPSNNNSMSVDTTSPTQYEQQTLMSDSQNIDHTGPLADGQHSFFSQSEEKCVLINTAMVYVLNSEGQRIALRSILDSASESSFISNDAVTVLGLKKDKANIPICGLGDSPLRVKKFASARVSNYKNDCNWAIKLLIVPKIADAMPSFADASAKADGACVYVHTEINSNKGSSHLLCSKSRVCPIKTVTIPKLELSLCLLLSQLIQKSLTALKHQIKSVQLFSDSTIALAWIKTSPQLLKPFVSNRVSQIQQLTSDFEWRHIPSELNPADLISRGLEAPALSHCELWWKGPELTSIPVPASDEPQPADQQFFEELKVLPKMAFSSHWPSHKRGITKC